MREKIIEEMAHCKLCYEKNFGKCFVKKRSGCSDWVKSQRLYSAGYRKVPEGSVVLCEEEYAELKFAKKLLELREEYIKSLEDANIRYAEALELKVNKKERKETAGDIAYGKLLGRQERSHQPRRACGVREKIRRRYEVEE